MGNGGYSSIIMIILMLVIFYLFLILPENKKKKKLNEMRSSLKVGDDIVTIGGMMGKVVHVTDDSVTFETSEDQVRIQVAKWAISTNARAEAQAADQAETVTHGDGAPPLEVGIRIREKPGQHVAVRVDPIGDGSDAVGHRNLAAARSLGGGGNGHHDDGRRHQQFLDHRSLFFRFYDC